VYALALERGWTAATRIEDGQLAAHVGNGLHPYRNYSRLHYGSVTLREALGNSLNIPAVKTLQFVGGERLLDRLQALGMDGLTAHPDWYGDGLALGNGEVTLYQLVQAYTALASGGRLQRLTLFEQPVEAQAPRQLIDREAASIITDILSDPRARLLEFGNGSLLRFPAQTAVKTGTSSDYRDAWTVAYNRRYLVGAWMGNLAAQPMDGVTGSIGPALLVRSVFATLNRAAPPRPLYRSPRLLAQTVRDLDGAERSEWFAPGTGPATTRSAEAEAGPPQLLQPFDGLRVAIDPRVPLAQQALEFQLQAPRPPRAVTWFVDGVPRASTEAPRWLWPLAPGAHWAYAELDGAATAHVSFLVK
jgi:penicillin-binding protein 1C